MKLMDLEPSYRLWLIGRGALNFDRYLNEKFVGLTHDESTFFLRMVKAALDPLYVRSEEEFDRFIELHEYHELELALGYQ
jgi:hypothetical protein